ncbi:MAG: hypothetical protein MI974_30505 [Chitinophagales bacterium]|nr:hypothetical protein [Chitinophagales bacterium]
MLKHLLSFIFIVSCLSLPAQKVLQIEKYGSPKTQKIQIGQYLNYQLKDDDHFSEGYIENILIEDSLLQIGNRYVKLNDIEKLRFNRRWAQASGSSLFWFGIGWSGFAAIGTAVDGDPDTSYQWSDAGVTLTAIGLSFLIPKLFKYKYLKLGNRKRLRLVDLRFAPEDWED